MSLATVTVVAGLLAVIAIGLQQRSTDDDQQAGVSLPVLLTALTLGGAAFNVTAGLSLSAWFAVALWAAGIPVALMLGREDNLPHDEPPVRCDYQSYLWEVPAAIFAAGFGYTSLAPSNPWTIRAAGIVTVVAAATSLVHGAAAALFACRSGLGWIHYQLDEAGIRFPSYQGARFIPWASIESTGSPINPHGLNIWFRPFTIRHESGTFEVSRVPRHHSFDDVHRFVTVNVDKAADEVGPASKPSNLDAS